MLSKCCTIIANILSNYCQYIAQDLASLTIDSICSIFIGILSARLVDMVQRALAIWARPWQELPAGTEDWEILRPAWELQADLK